MTSADATGSDRAGAWFERIATAIGDLDSPFFDEERDRDVWNEASAVGFQTMLWGVPIVATVCIWVGGPTALPYVGALFAPWALGALLAIVYAERRAVDPSRPALVTANPWRASLLAVVIGVLGAGTLRAALHLADRPDVSSFVRGMAHGMAIGLVAAAIALLVLALRGAWRRRSSAEGADG